MVVNNSNIFNNGANVGVGSTAPNSKLEVVSTTTHTYPTPGTGFGTLNIAPNTNATNDQSAAITFSATQNVSGAQAGIYVQSSGAYGTKMYFGTTDSYTSGSKARMLVDYNGNVGIGNISPSHTLDVNGIVNATTGFRVNGAAPAANVYMKGDGTKFTSGTIQASDVPTLNQNTTGYATYLKSPFPYNINISDATTAASLTEPGSLSSVNMHASHGLFGSWATTSTMSGYDRYGAYQISGNYNSATPELSIRNYVQSSSTWNNWVKVITTANIGSQAVNYANITNLPDRSTWASGNPHRGLVAEQLSWKNYGNGHTIIDASAGTAPNGTAINNTTAQVPWSATYPTLMGWNGANTYGIRVDASRVSDNAANANTVGGMGAGSFMQYQGFTLDANTMTANRSGFTYAVNAPSVGPIVHIDASNYGLQINSGYSNAGISYRTRNGDAGTWNPWREFITTANVGSYGDNLGNHTATTTLNMNGSSINNVADIISNQNFGLGLVGLYAADRYQNVFAMGGAYRIPANGTTPGNLYGIAWTHTNVGGESKSGLSHQALFMSNGITQTAIGTGIWTTGHITTNGNLYFNAANPTISASSYFIAPGGAYFNSGTVYTTAQIQARGGIHNDNAAELTIAGGTSALTYFSGSISGMSGNTPANSLIRHTPNLHLNSLAGYATILNWDNGTTGATQTLRVGNGAGSDIFNVYANGNTSIGTASSAYPLYVYNPNNAVSIYADNSQSTGTNNSSMYGYIASGAQGTGYGTYVNRAAVRGLAYWGYSYTFGVSGVRYNDGYNRGGGVFGGSSTDATPTSWGVVGYRNSGAGYNGIYGNAAYASGGGYLDQNIYTGTGGAFYGDLIGSWAKGELMGQVASGDMFASYNLGNEYTSGHQADIVSTGDKRVAAYSVTSTDLKIYADGNGALNGTSVFVPFENDYAQMLGSTPTVTISAVGSAAPIYIKSVTKTGFTVAVDNAVNAQFNWIAVAKRVDADKKDLPAAIADRNFDKNMTGVMFNENNKEQSATPVWFDGDKLRFDEAPQRKAAPKPEEDRTAVEAKAKASAAEVTRLAKADAEKHKSDGTQERAAAAMKAEADRLAKEPIKDKVPAAQQ